MLYRDKRNCIGPVIWPTRYINQSQFSTVLEILPRKIQTVVLLLAFSIKNDINFTNRKYGGHFGGIRRQVTATSQLTHGSKQVPACIHNIIKTLIFSNISPAGAKNSYVLIVLSVRTPRLSYKCSK